MRFSLLTIVFMLALFSSLQAQILSVTPAFPTQNDNVTIVYDATQGNGALAGFTGTVYAHTGVILSGSSGWQHVKGNWGTADPTVQMTSLGNNKYQISFNITTFYGVLAGETVTQLAFVFRNAAGTTVGRDVGGTDIFYNVSQGSQLQLSIQNPSTSGNIYQINNAIKVKAVTSANANLSLYLNNALVGSTTNTDTIEYNTTATTPGQYWARVEADNGSTIVKDSVYYLIQGTPTVANPPAGTQPGVTYLSPNSVRLSLYAPNKNFVYAIGDFNDWLPASAYQMNKSQDGKTWWVDLQNITPGQEYAYQFLVDGNLKVADPYCEKTLDPWNDSYIPATVYPNLKPYPANKTTGVVSVFQTNQTPYVWQTTNFQTPNKKDLVIYELLVRDFIAAHSYKAVLDSLPYLKRLGINAIELMPVSEFDGNVSWGYTPNFQFAVDKYYGTKDDLKYFIDQCHAQGIAVLLDIVLNHQFGLSPMVQLYWDAANNKPAANNPWFNADATHPFNVGYDMNHDSPDTRVYSDRVLKHWVTNFKFDGFRFDLSSGWTQTNSGGNIGTWQQYDAGRVYNVKRMADSIRLVNPNLHLIYEHFTDNSEMQELSNYGLMLWGNMNYSYMEASMGWVNTSDISGISYKSRGWSNPNLVGYMESHDEERLMYKNLMYGNSNGAYNIKTTTTALERVEMMGAFFFTVPGPKMIWQFGEIGYDKTITLCADGVTMNTNCRTDIKPILWQYFGNLKRRKLYSIWRKLIYLKENEPAVETNNFTMNVGNGVKFKTIHLNDPSANITVIGNFDVTSTSGNPDFQSTGTWYDYISGDSIQVTNTTANITLNPGEYHVYINKKVAAPAGLSIDNEFITKPFNSISFPNPFDNELTIGFMLDKNAATSVKIYNLMGQEVRSLVNNEMLFANEIQEIHWNGTDNAGNFVSAGTYLYVIESNGKRETGRVMFAK